MAMKIASAKNAKPSSPKARPNALRREPGPAVRRLERGARLGRVAVRVVAGLSPRPVARPGAVRVLGRLRGHRHTKGNDGVYTTTVGTAPQRDFVIEWRASRPGGFTTTFPPRPVRIRRNFEVIFHENS